MKSFDKLKQLYGDGVLRKRTSHKENFTSYSYYYRESEINENGFRDGLHIEYFAYHEIITTFELKNYKNGILSGLYFHVEKNKLVDYQDVKNGQREGEYFKGKK